MPKSTYVSKFSHVSKSSYVFKYSYRSKPGYVAESSFFTLFPRDVMLDPFFCFVSPFLPKLRRRRRRRRRQKHHTNNLDQKMKNTRESTNKSLRIYVFYLLP